MRVFAVAFKGRNPSEKFRMALTNDEMAHAAVMLSLPEMEFLASIEIVFEAPISAFSGYAVSGRNDLDQIDGVCSFRKLPESMDDVRLCVEAIFRRLLTPGSALELDTN